jgi:hypothetical protein
MQFSNSRAAEHLSAIASRAERLSDQTPEICCCPEMVAAAQLTRAKEGACWMLCDVGVLQICAAVSDLADDVAASQI